MTTIDLSADERAALQRRVIRVLTAGQIVGGLATAIAVTIGAFVVQEALGDDTAWGGLAVATVTVGSGFMSRVLSTRMVRTGRRGGLQVGYGLAAIGGLLAAAGAEWTNLPLFVVGLFVFSNGQAANLLARYVAADLAEPHERGSAISRVVFASTFGAVFGPLLISPAQRAGEALGFGTYTGPWLAGSLFFTLAGINIAARLRPDPLAVAGGVDPHARRADAPRLGAVLAVISASPGARVALLAMVVSQAAMVAVMTMTPVHMRIHGHESLSHYVISLHIAGMFAFSPLVGRFADRQGRELTILIGAGILAFSTVLAALAGDGPLLLFPALFALGVGWNFGLIGGSTLLTESVPEDDRVRVQGAADFTMSVLGGVAGFSSGFVRSALGYPMLSNLATALAVTLLAVAVVHLMGRRRLAALDA
ncbi:MAG: MFS transporter [Acidimicrobiales bacterium]